MQTPCRVTLQTHTWITYFLFSFIMVLVHFLYGYLRLQMRFLKRYGTYIILLKNQLQYSTEIEKRKENRPVYQTTNWIHSLFLVRNCGPFLFMSLFWLQCNTNRFWQVGNTSRLEEIRVLQCLPSKETIGFLVDWTKIGHKFILKPHRFLWGFMG